MNYTNVNRRHVFHSVLAIGPWKIPMFNATIFLKEKQQGNCAKYLGLIATGEIIIK
jgi:hypothetical protein